MEKCIRCNGKGFIEFYKENKGGICFICWGDGYEFKTKEEKYEFYSVKYLFELEEHIKEDLGINIKIEDYFNMSYRDRKKFIIQKEEELDELKYSIECGKFEEAQNSGYDTYEEYEEAMEWEMMEYDY